MFVKTKDNIYDIDFLFEDSKGNYLNNDWEIVIKKEDIVDENEDLIMLFDAFIIYNIYEGFVHVTGYKETKHMRVKDLDKTYFNEPPMDEEHILYGAIFVWEKDELGKDIFNIKTITKGRGKGQFFSLIETRTPEE